MLMTEPLILGISFITLLYIFQVSDEDVKTMILGNTSIFYFFYFNFFSFFFSFCVFPQNFQEPNIILLLFLSFLLLLGNQR